METKLEKAINEKGDMLITNDINGDVFAVVTKGVKKLKRLTVAIQEEFDFGIIEFQNLKTVNNGGISFEIYNADADIRQFIRIFNAFIY